MDPYKELANGIVLRAVKDYKAALRRERKGNKNAKKEIKELESFFRSAWFKVLSDLDGEELITTLRAAKPQKKKKTDGKGVKSRDSKGIHGAGKSS